MHVLLVTSTFPSAPDDGTPRFVYDLADHLAQCDQVTVLAPHGPKLPIHQRMGRLTIKRFQYMLPAHAQRLAYGAGMPHNIAHSWSARFQVAPYMLALAAAIRTCMRQTPFDVINSHWLLPQAAAVCAALGHRRPCAHVATIHGGDLFALERLPAARAIARFITRRTDMILPVGRHLAERLDRLCGRAVPAAVEPMGVNLAHFAAPPRNPGRLPFGGHFILFVGRLIPIKGVDGLLRAMAHTMAADPHVGLVVVGSGPMEMQLRRLAQTLGIAPRVQFTGALGHTTLVSYLAACRALAVPSRRGARGRTEGMPTVVIEGLAAGCQVVASKVGAIADMITDGVNGWLVPPEDDRALANALTAVLQADNAGTADNARQSAALFDWRLVADRYRTHFKSAIKRVARGG